MITWPQLITTLSTQNNQLDQNFTVGLIKKFARYFSDGYEQILFGKIL